VVIQVKTYGFANADGVITNQFSDIQVGGQSLDGDLTRTDGCQVPGAPVLPGLAQSEEPSRLKHSNVIAEMREFTKDSDFCTTNGASGSPSVVIKNTQI
jgi:hypothetical protein